LGTPLVSEDGTSRVSGHTLRPTGAQGLTRMGLDIWAVQLLGRWGSSVVQRYVRDAATGTEAARARTVFLSRSLASLSADAAAQCDRADLRSYASAEAAAALERLTPTLSEQVKACLLPDLLSALTSSRVPGSVKAPSSSSSSSSSSSDFRDIDSDAEPAAGAARQADAQPDLPPPACPSDFVSSARSGRRHKVLIGPSSSLSPWTWVCACGWKFGRVSGARFPEPGDRDCISCFGP